MSDLLESQRRRAEARQRRRAANGGGTVDDDGQREGGGLDLKATAKTVAASAATGATLEAARTVVERATRHKRDEEAESASGESSEEPVDVKAAAKRAATAAAVGAGLGAARALASRPSDERSDSEPAEPEPEPFEEEGAPTAGYDEPDLRRAYERPPRDDVPGADLGQVKRVVTAAREQLEALQGRAVESVSGVERTHSGWTVSLEVVELARIPETTDLLATYELVLDGDANLVRYSRVRRYNRSQADEGPEA